MMLQTAQLRAILQLSIVLFGEEVALTSHPVLSSKGWNSEGFPLSQIYF